MRTTAHVALAVLITASAVLAQGAHLDENQRIIHVLSRLTFGPRPGDIEAVKAEGLNKWIERQLASETEQDPALKQIKERFVTLGLMPKEREALLKASTENKDDEMKMDGRLRRRLASNSAEELRMAIVERALYSNRQAFEVLSDFWRNHFNVDVNKESVQQTASHYEETVIRPFALGRFLDLLSATAKHPAMLVYLDNYLSRAPPNKQEIARIERQARRQTGSRERAQQQVELALQRGLNENYARELMELHTLGVDNGYSQEDVQEVAKAFTGWTLNRADGAYEFSYQEDMHAGGKKIFLGKQLPRGRGDTGMIEGESILKILAAHKNTAAFVSKKLCVRLVNDTPPQSLIDVGAKAFTKSKGNIAEVVRAIVTNEEFYDPRHFQAKFKTPPEFVISALRATNAEIDDSKQVVEKIHSLGLVIYGCEDPTGYSDATEAWRDPGVMALRWKFAVDLVRGRIDGVRIPESFYKDLPKNVLKLSRVLEARLVPQGLGKDTRRVLERVLFREVQKAGSIDDVDQLDVAELLTGILIGCPEFQQQ